MILCLPPGCGNNFYDYVKLDTGTSCDSGAGESSVDLSDNIMRGSDELLSQTSSLNNVSNGTIMNSQNDHNENNNDAKKVKLDKTQVGKPSRVIHLRNIPNEVTETEIIHLGMPFGRVTNVLVLKGKNQAFLEMGDEGSAIAMVGYFAHCNAQIRGRSVYVQYSNHTELRTNSSHSNAQATTQAALQASQTLLSGQQPTTTNTTPVSTASSETQGGPNTVLRVIVEHMVYPVTLDILYQIFSRYGKVLKIVTFTKNSSFQALVQYPDVLTAQSAKLNLDGQNIYNSCCTLRIDYSKLTNLNVKYNNDKSRDYTNPTNFLSCEPNMDGIAAFGGSMQPGGGIVGGQSANPFAAMAAMHGLTNLQHPLSTAYGSTIGVPLGGFGLPGSIGGASSAAALRAAGILLPGQLPHASSVLLISNLNEEMVTPRALFTLFGVYGDVHRVKILFNKKDNALIQMAEAYQAQIALKHLDKVSLFGKPIRVTPSKHDSVQMPKDGQPDSGLTKDFTNSSLHRFKKPGSKNFLNIYPPSATLHLSNIPPDFKEEDILKAFEEATITVKAFKFFPNNHKMALIQLNDVEDAVIALIKMHNHQLSDSSHLRVSFSKSTI